MQAASCHIAGPNCRRFSHGHGSAPSPSSLVPRITRSVSAKQRRTETTLNYRTTAVLGNTKAKLSERKMSRSSETGDGSLNLYVCGVILLRVTLPATQRCGPPHSIAIAATVLERYSISRHWSARSWRMWAFDSCVLYWFCKLGCRFKDFRGRRLRGHAIILAFYRLSSNSPLARETAFSNFRTASCLTQGTSWFLHSLWLYGQV